MANLASLVPAGRDLSSEEQSKIQELQDEIDEIWNRRGNYQIDPDAWKTMPLFMENITEEDVQRNEACAALADIVYNELPPDEVAENMKAQGNKSIQRVMSGEQTVNPDNMCRAAIHCYSEGLKANAPDTKVNAQLYANRAMAHFLMQNFGHGLQDAQRAIVLNPHYTKAFYRGARCAERVRKFEIALNLIEKGLQTECDAVARQEFEELRQRTVEHREAVEKKHRSDKLKTRAKAAESASMTRVLQGKGVTIVAQTEVSSDQMAQYNQGGRVKPYVDDEGIVHVPILFMYDEFDTTDFVADVATDCCMAEVLEDMLPFPFDEGRGRYATLEDIVCFFKIDDGVKMPEYFEVDLGWQLLEVLRSKNYKMPGLQPVFHIVSRHSTELLKRFGLRQA